MPALTSTAAAAALGWGRRHFQHQKGVHAQASSSAQQTVPATVSQGLADQPRRALMLHDTSSARPGIDAAASLPMHKTQAAHDLASAQHLSESAQQTRCTEQQPQVPDEQLQNVRQAVNPSSIHKQEQKQQQQQRSKSPGAPLLKTCSDTSDEDDDDFAALDCLPKVPARLSGFNDRNSPALSAARSNSIQAQSSDVGDLDALDDLPTRRIPAFKPRMRPILPSSTSKAGGAAPIALIPVGPHSDPGQPAPGRQQGAGNAAQPKHLHQHQPPSRGGQQAPAVSTAYGLSYGNSAGQSSQTHSGNIRQIQRPCASRFIPPRKVGPPQVSQAAVLDASPSGQPPASDIRSTTAAAMEPPAPIKLDRDAFAGSSTPGPDKPALPGPRSMANEPSLLQKQQLAKSYQPRSQQAAVHLHGQDAEHEMALMGKGQAVKSRLAAGPPLARRRLVKAAQLPLPDTQVYEQPGSSPFHQISPNAASPPSSAKPHDATAQTNQREKSPVIYPQGGTDGNGPGRMFSPGAADGKRQRRWSDPADDTHQSHPSEDKGPSAAPCSPALSEPASVGHQLASTEALTPQDEHFLSSRRKRPRAPLQRLFEPPDEMLGDADDPWMSASQCEAKRKQAAEDAEEAELLDLAPGFSRRNTCRAATADLSDEALTALIQQGSPAPLPTLQQVGHADDNGKEPAPVQHRQQAGDKGKARAANPFVSASSALLQKQGSRLQHPPAQRTAKTASAEPVGMEDLRSLLQPPARPLGHPENQRQHGQFRQPRPVARPEIPKAHALQARASRWHASAKSRPGPSAPTPENAELDYMSEGVEVLEVDDNDDDFGGPHPSRRHWASIRDDMGLDSNQRQATGQPMAATNGDGIIDLEADEDRPSSICTSRSEGRPLPGPPWWHRFPHFTPLAALQNNRDPRSGALAHVDFVSQFSSAPSPEGHDMHPDAARPSHGSSYSGGAKGRGRRKTARRKQSKKHKAPKESGRWVTEHTDGGSIKVFVTPDGIKHTGQAAWRKSKPKRAKTYAKSKLSFPK
ncbi:hypothetical protein WJX74_007624 [Apatococcus lobatus]|uniref:Uncharacterized protein n=1 Tax=Apatococcus lobatus TaxID=904363 RepID=A0AAW1RQ46_9CHLO